MNIINVRKAQPIHRDDGDDVPDTVITIGRLAGTIPRDEDPALTVTVFDREAKALALALRNALPGGTFDRLIAELLMMKASQFRVNYGV